MGIYSCNATFCDTYDDRYYWYIAAEIFGWGTTLWELRLTFVYLESFMMVEMVSDENAGWLHKHVFEHVEYLWETPLAWICTVMVR